MKDFVHVNTTAHGDFYGSIESVRKLEKWSKRELAGHITNMREDKYTFTYWMRFPKAVLVVMAADFRADID